MPEPVVLLVEDEPLVLLVAQDALEAGGYTVLPAQISSEALDVLDSRIGELSGLVTDIRLPGGPDGITDSPAKRSIRVLSGLWSANEVAISPSQPEHQCTNSHTDREGRERSLGTKCASRQPTGE